MRCWRDVLPCAWSLCMPLLDTPPAAASRAWPSRALPRTLLKVFLVASPTRLAPRLAFWPSSLAETEPFWFGWLTVSFWAKAAEPPTARAQARAMWEIFMGDPSVQSGCLYENAAGLPAVVGRL